MNYLFYDLETTGLCESFDQIVRFAAIRTDENLQEINRYEIDIKLRPDVVPSPEALVVTGLSISDIQLGLCEYDALMEIHKLFNQPNQINIGYNSLKFDNTILRFSFYRNLLDPYSHQYKNNAYRADVMNVNLLYYLYKRDVLEWTDDKPIKLENINEKNNLVQGKSHDALVDVIVTLELSRRLRAYDSRMWDYLISGFVKSNDISRLKKLPVIDVGESSYQIGLYTNVALGYSINSCCAAICVGRHSVYKNQSLWMRLDFNDISEKFSDDGGGPYLMKRKDGEPEFILPYSDEYSHVLGQERLENVNNNILWLSENVELFEQYILDQSVNEYEKYDNLDLDASIYESGIFTQDELKSCRAFHACSNDQKLHLIQNTGSSRVKDIGLRIAFRNFPSALDDKQKEDIMNSIISSDSLSMKCKTRRTPSESIERSNTMLQSDSLSPDERQILVDLVSHLNQSD